MNLDPETVRLQAAIAAIHDHLHAGRVNEAHAACECAMTGGAVKQTNLTIPDSAKAQVFAAGFNDLCRQSDVRAAFVLLMPSATRPGFTSIQIGGEVSVCKLVERMAGGQSIYQGEH